MDLIEARNNYISDKYNFLDASSKVCQDVILSKIAKSPLSKHVTIKGGVVIHNISNDSRRATRDIDLDFIRYSLADEAIQKFVNTLNNVDDGISINIVAPIEELSQQEYNGKRVIAELMDGAKNKIGIKLDIGVHKNIKIE